MSSLSGSTTGASGRKADVAPECLKDYKDLKTKRKYKFMTIKIEDESFTLVTEKKGGKNDTIDQFLGSLPHSRCRYLVYDQQYKNPEGRIIEKLFYIIWTPGSAPSRERVGISCLCSLRAHKTLPEFQRQNPPRRSSTPPKNLPQRNTLRGLRRFR
eukprot:gb/GECG01010181.1/.p1 GENE.gb/GECG01010181.1/~~gb/GECG01010181.1/.p1  ORF type:complete len:156 (+),score=10.42 gb/GECG01010181.1/:1-468(+)